MAVYYNDEGDLKLLAGSTMYADNPIGSILPFGGTKAPNGWFLCQGQALSRTEYADLFKAIGTSFGAGDGSTTFNIPDLRGEFLRGAGANSHSGQGNGGTVGEHQDATNQIDITGWGNQIYFDPTLTSSAINYDSRVQSDTYQYLQNEAGHTGTQQVASTYTARPTNTSVNYIIKAKHVSVPADFTDAVDDAVVRSRLDWSNAIPISVQQLYNGYTCPKEGMFYMFVAIEVSTSDKNQNLTINNINVARILGIVTGSTNTRPTQLTFPVSEDDVLKITGTGVAVSSYSYNYIYLIPYKE